MRSIPENNLSYPVQIKFDNGSSGSGFNFYFNNFLFFVTAKHVLVNESNNLHGKTGNLTAYSPEISDETPTVLEIDFDGLMLQGNIILHPDKDVAVMKIGEVFKKDDKISFKLFPEIKFVSKSNKGIVWTSEETIVKYESVLVGNDVIIFGYPSSIGMQTSPQFDYNRPLLRKGIIASKYKKANTIILDCPVYYGNSGGPAIQIEEDKGKNFFKVIGVISQFVPYVENWINTKNKVTNTTVLNSGYSVAVSIDSVIEIMK